MHMENWRRLPPGASGKEDAGAQLTNAAIRQGRFRVPPFPPSNSLRIRGLAHSGLVLVPNQRQILGAGWNRWGLFRRHGYGTLVSGVFYGVSRMQMAYFFS